MASSYHLTVKKYLEQKNKIFSPLPEYIQRGWNRIYTSEEEEFLKCQYIISPDGYIPNSVVRHRLGTLQMFQNARLKILHKALELPVELFMNLSREHSHRKIIEEENLFFQWDDDETEHFERKRRQSSMDILFNKQREKRRKYDEYKYDYDILERLDIEEIVEEIRTNIGKNLNNEDIQLITELMQIISNNKNEQIMNVYNELSRLHLIDKFGTVPKLVQTLQEIQKAFEQVAMKTNIASIETVLIRLREKDKTYRIALELLNLFNEKTKKNRIFNFNNKSNEISDYDHKVFNILIKDRINQLSTTNLIMLINDLKTIQSIDTNKLNDNRDDQMRILLEQLNIIFTHTHLDGIKMIFNIMKSSISNSLKEFIEKIENSLKTKLIESDQIIIESYILDHLNFLNDNESKIVYERLAQQGTLKRLTEFNELNQSITMNLMKKLNTDGLGIIVENIKDTHLEINAIHELTQTLSDINQHLQTQSLISLEQLQKQLDMAYFIEIRNLNQDVIHELAKAVHLYSIASISLAEDATNEQCSTFLEQLKIPFINKCIQRILRSVYQENLIDLNKISKEFYQQQIRDMFNELIHGSDRLNNDLFINQIKERLKKIKELPEKLYRQMLKDKFISIDTNMKINTDKKKVTIIIDTINRILNKDKDSRQQKQLIELFNQMDVSLPERIKHWYINKSNGSKVSSSPTKIMKDTIKEKTNITAKIPTKTKSLRTMNKPEQMKDRRQSLSSKRDDELKKSLLKSRTQVQTNERVEKKPSKFHIAIEKVKTNINSETSIASSEPSQMDHIPELESIMRNDFILASQVIKETSEYIDHPKSYSIHENIELVDASVDFQPDTTIQIERDSNKLSPHVEDYVETDVRSSPSDEICIHQADLQTIESVTIIDGQMGQNQTLHFELDQTAARLFYHFSLSNDPKQDINIKQTGQIAQLLNDSPYEKIKTQRILAKSIPTDLSHVNVQENLTNSDHSPISPQKNNVQPNSITTNLEKSSDLLLDESSSKISHRTQNKLLKQTDNNYINSLTKSLNNLFIQSKYNNVKLRKLHDELIISGHISPLNEFYRSTNEAVRVTLEHCNTYNELIKWTLSLLQTTNKSNLIEFGHDLYSIAIDLDFILNERIDYVQCAIEIKENLKHQLFTINEHDLREINSYLNAAQLDKVIHISKKLNVTSKNRMINDLIFLLLHLIQICHTFDWKYRPMQTHIHEIGNNFKSKAVIDLARKLDEIEKHLAKIFGITLFSISQRMNESKFDLIK